MVKIVTQNGLPARPSPNGIHPNGPSRVSAVSRVFQGHGGVVGETMRFIMDYIAMPDVTGLAIAAWVQAAHFIDAETAGPWDQFPILAVTSPEKRCAKSTLLELLGFISPRADLGKFLNPSPAVFYRTVEKHRPTIIMDECQSLKRRASESSEVLREIMGASVRRDERVARCVGDNHEPKMFSVYSPKIVAMIGDPDHVFNDRCMPVRLKRKTKEDRVQRFRYREVKERGLALRDRLEQWAIHNREHAQRMYDRLEPFDIDNDRMADLLMPLQTVAALAGMQFLETLERYAAGLDDRDREQSTQTPGVRLLAACRELFRGKEFIQSDDLIALLCSRLDEPWRTWNNGQPISRERLAGLLRPYEIKSERTKDQKQTGYWACDFEEAWRRYLPLENPAIPANPARPGYEAYLNSPRWVAFAEKVRNFWGRRCAICNRTGPLDVHHRTYERIGREEMTDCLALCRGCHELVGPSCRSATTPTHSTAEVPVWMLFRQLAKSPTVQPGVKR